MSNYYPPGFGYAEFPQLAVLRDQRAAMCQQYCGCNGNQANQAQWERCPPSIIGQVCEPNADPVCVRGLTFANSCAACAVPGIQGFRRGPC